MHESRTPAILAGAAIVVGALWAPWYAIDFGPATRAAIAAQTGRLPGVLGDFARQMLMLLPSHIEIDAWQALEKGDIVLLVCALAAGFAALLGRMEVVGLAGAAAAGTVIVEMLDRPGPNQIVSLQWGAWVALAGALLIVGASRISSRRPVATNAAPPDRTRQAVSQSDGEAERSFAPF